MAFQFLCPRGHLLQGEETLAGRQCRCPSCGTLFLIPPPLPRTEAPSAAPAPSAPDADPGGFPNIRTKSVPSRQGRAAARPPVLPSSGRPPELVHISCPTGHELETPREMLGRLAMCPFCRAQFHLRWENSVEYQSRTAAEHQHREAKIARFWFRWSITAAVVVVLGLILTIVLANVRW